MAKAEKALAVTDENKFEAMGRLALLVCNDPPGNGARVQRNRTHSQHKKVILFPYERSVTRDVVHEGERRRPADLIVDLLEEVYLQHERAFWAQRLHVREFFADSRPSGRGGVMVKQRKRSEGDAEGLETFCRHMLGHTARLVRIQDGQPCSGGSGVLYQTGERLFLLSVVHVFERTGWSIETDSSSGGTTLLIELPPVNWLVRGTIDAANISIPRDADGLAWAELDIQSLRTKLAADPRAQERRIELALYAGPIDQHPTADEMYGFAAAPPRDFVPELGQLNRDTVCEVGMRYIGDDDRGFYRFVLDGRHKGDAYYKGSSGSPIADPTGLIVALVQGGCEDDNVVYGVPLRLYAGVITL